MADDVTLRITAEVTDALRKIEITRNKYLAMAAELPTVGRAVEQAFSKFNGDDLKRNALAAAGAIERIGGASKLTAKEQQQVNVLVADALAKYKALGQEAPAALHKLWTQTKNLGEETKRSGDFFNRAFFRLTGAITAADLAAQLIVKTFSLVKDGIVAAGEAIGYLVMQGSKVNMISEGFFKLQNAMGQLGGKTLDAVREKTLGLISDFDLMQAANRAMLFGLEVTPEKFAVLGDAAVKLGRAMGMTAAKSMDDLVLALGRVSPRILDNLGIIVKVGEANLKWAAAHHKTVQQMTAAERVQAFYEESLRKIEEHVRNLGDVTLTLADRIKIMQTHWTNWVNNLALAVNLSPVLQEALFHIATLMQQSFGKQNSSAIQIIVGLIEDLAIWTVKAAEAVIELGKGVNKSFGEGKMLVNAFALSINSLIAGTVDGLILLAKVRKELAVTVAAKNLWGDTLADLEIYRSNLEGLRQNQRDAIEEGRRQIQNQDAVGKSLEMTGKFLTQLRQNMERAKTETADYSKVQDRLTLGTFKLKETEEDVADAMKNSSKEREALAKKTSALAAALDLALKHGTPAATVLKEYGAAITDVINRSQVFEVEVPKSIQHFAEVMEDLLPPKEKLIKASIELVKVLNQMQTGMDMDEVANAYGNNIMDMVDKLKIFKFAVPEVLRAWDEALRQYKETMAEVKRFNDELNASVTRWVASQEAAADVFAEFNAKLLKITESSVDARLAELDREVEEAKAKLGPNTGLTAEWQKAMDAILAYQKKKAEEIKGTWTGMISKMAHELPKTILAAFQGGGDALKASIFKLSSMLGEQLFGPGSSMGKMIGQFTANLATKMSPGLAKAFTKVMGDTIPILGTLFAYAVVGIVKGIKRAITGPSEIRLMAHELGREFGQSFSKGLTDKLVADAKRLGDRMAAIGVNLKAIIEESGGVNSSNAWKWIGKARDLFVFLERGIISSEEAVKSLNDVVPMLAATFQKSGGIWSAQFRELIDLTKREGLEVQAVIDLIEAQVSKLVSGTNKVVSGFTTPFLKEWEKLDAELTKSKEAIDKVKESATTFDGSKIRSEMKKIDAEMTKLMKSGADIDPAHVKTSKSAARFDELAKKWDGLNRQLKKGQEAANKTTEELNKANQAAGLTQEKIAELAAKGQVEFDRLNRISLRTFNNMLSEGKTPIEAIDAIGTSIDDLIKLQDKLGLKSSAAFEEMKRWRTLVETNRPLIEQAAGLNDILVASINLRKLDADSFADLQAQGLDTYKKLNEAGFTQNEALLQMAPFLQSVIDAHEQSGVAIGEETQALIDQAKADGILKEKQISTNDILMEGLGAIIKAVGGDLPEAWQKMADKAKEAADKTATELGDVTGKVSAIEQELHDNELAWRDWRDSVRTFTGDAQDGVDGVSFGSSPGGLKEWQPMIERSRKAMLEFARDAKRGLGDVKRGMDDVHRMKPSSAHMGAVMDRSNTMAIQARGKVPDGGIWVEKMEISTWTVDKEWDLIKKRITPQALKAIHDGGENYEQFENLTRKARK